MRTLARQVRVAVVVALVALGLAARAASAQDAINPKTVTVEGGAADVLTWPITSTFTAWQLSPGNMHTVYGKQGQWTPVDIGGGTLQESTLWVFLQVGGRWYGAGAERLRPNQTDKPEGQDVARVIPDDWLYDAHRWPTMAGHALTAGETFGVMVAAGSTRSDHTVAVQARTPIRLARFDGQTAALVATPAPSPSLAPPSKDVVLAASQGLDPEASTSLQTIVTRLAARGYAISVMAAGNGQPSDHKVWWNGEAWTFISSDNYQHGSYRWDPYVQAAYDGSGFSACGIPTSAHQSCPSWSSTATPSSNPGPQTSGPAPGASISQAQLDTAVAAIEAHDDQNTAKVQAQIDQVVKNAENTGKSIWKWLGPLLAALGAGAGVAVL